VQVLGNKIYNNSTFGGLAQGLPGLGLSLIRIQGSGEVDQVYGLSVNPQDPMQPDQGPNNLQNSPVMTSATTSAGKLTIAGTLQSVPNTSYTIELFADEFKSPYGAGEGQQFLGRLNLLTDASGHGTFSAEGPAPGPNSQYISATATTLPPGGEPGVTSEFALDAKIEAGPPEPAPAGPPPAGKPTTPPSGTAQKTGIVEHSGSLTVTVSAVSFTLPGVTVECASTSSACTASATASEGASGKASAASSGKKSKKKHGKAPVVLAAWSAKIAPGHAAPVLMTLTSAGKAQLKRKHTLSLTVTITVRAGTAKAITQTVHLQLKSKPAKTKKKPKHKG
jgi:hypothetical protein